MARFSNGFVLCADPSQVPGDLKPGPVFPELHVGDDLEVESAGNPGSGGVVVIGACLSVRGGESTRVAGELLEVLGRGERYLIERLGAYAGRYVVIYGAGDSRSVVQDATAMTPIYYARRGGIAGSHARLVDEVLGSVESEERRPSRFGYSGVESPHRRIRMLTAGTVYDLHASRVRRFWPDRPIVTRSAREAAPIIVEQVVSALSNALLRRPVTLELRSDLTALATLACSVHAPGDKRTFSMLDRETTCEELEYIRRLVSHVGWVHEEIDATEMIRLHWPEVGAHIPRESGASLIRDEKAGGEIYTILPTTLFAVATAREAARALGRRQPLTAEGMVSAHEFPGAITAATPQFHRQWVAFDEYIRVTGFDAASGIINPFDQFYIEHRLSAWHALTNRTTASFISPICPFNSRETLNAILSVTPDEREQTVLLRALVDEAASIPSALLAEVEV